LCPQTFIVKILIIETSAATVFYSTTERRGNRKVAVETERERVWVCVHCEKMQLASIMNERLGMNWHYSCENYFFTTLFVQETYSICEKGKEEERS
jgi:hypothetical protein